jgi:hypothetical protein
VQFTRASQPDGCTTVALTLRDPHPEPLLLRHELLDKTEAVKPSSINNNISPHGLNVALLAFRQALPARLELDDPACAVILAVDSHDAGAGHDYASPRSYSGFR